MKSNASLLTSTRLKTVGDPYPTGPVGTGGLEGAGAGGVGPGAGAGAPGTPPEIQFLA
jgi:hypothetical protein